MPRSQKLSPHHKGRRETRFLVVTSTIFGTDVHDPKGSRRTLSLCVFRGFTTKSVELRSQLLQKLTVVRTGKCWPRWRMRPRRTTLDFLDTIPFTSGQFSRKVLAERGLGCVTCFPRGEPQLVVLQLWRHLASGEWFQSLQEAE